jgi:hypothetical protein
MILSGLRGTLLIVESGSLTVKANRAGSSAPNLRAMGFVPARNDPGACCFSACWFGVVLVRR